MTEPQTHFISDDLVQPEKNPTITVNLGPTHPATHGILQNVVQLDGEHIVSTEPTVGYIHRAFEKLAEHRPFYQITPLTDRLNYCSAPINNMGWHLTVEKLLSVQTNKKVDYMRIVIMELARIADHIICNSILGVDSGAFSGFLYMFQKREDIYEIYEEVCGSRLTTNIGRIGGFERDFSPAAIAKIHKFLKEFPETLTEFENLFNRNRIFMDRTVGVGGIKADRALNYGFTGPNLRSAGIDYDIRVATPYSSYQDFEFDIPVGSSGDCYDRFMVRNAEMRESLKLIAEAMKRMPQNESYHVDVPEFFLPPKELVYSTMEALIYHFKIVMGEIPVPVGEVYLSVEGGNGEVGYYLESNGGRCPDRLHFRRPCFIFYQAFPEIVKGALLSDAVMTLSSLNVIAGELDA